MSRKYPLSDVKKLYGNSAGRCAFPSCRTALILEKTKGDDSKQIGKIAHIVAHSAGGPRANPGYPSKRLDTYDNWILLCPTCHDTIDAQPSTYTPGRLHEIKKDHEKWVQDSLEAELPYVGFAELEIAVKGISQQGSGTTSGFVVITPDEKIAKNELTVAVRNLLAMGLMRGPEVKRYLSEMDKINSGFAERVTAGFQDEYERLRKEGLRGDELFDALLNFASSGSTDFKVRAAGLALLSHLFELCEVFEK